nr:hypothetical protein [Tanacetum cinerariifolium]
MRTTMKSERWNQDLSLTGKLIQPFGQGLLWSVGNEKEFWYLRKHQTWKEAIEEGTPKGSCQWENSEFPFPGPDCSNFMKSFNPNNDYYRIYRINTSTNHNPMISPTFVEAKVLESLLTERQRQIHNEDLQTELEYLNEDYDEEREMEPRHEPNREATPTLRPRPPKTSEQTEKDKSTTPAKASILMIRHDDSYTKNKFEGLTSKSKKIAFPSAASNSSAPVVIKAKDKMQKIESMVSTIHGAIKFHTTRGIGTVFSTHESDKVRGGMKKVRETSPSSEKWVFSYTMTEEKVVINNKYPEQTFAIGKQLPEQFKGRLRDLLSRLRLQKHTWNAEATYQRLVDKFFHDQIGRNLEAYVDNMPKMLKDVQSLNGNIAALSRFLSKGVERSLPFFKPSAVSYQRVSKDHFPSSRVLQGLELNYPEMEKLILALVHAASRLRRGDKTPKDFLIEVPLENSKKKAEEKANTKSMKTKLSCEWKLFTYGAASFDGSDAGLMLIDPKGKEYTYALCFEFETTNNEAEYEELSASQATNDQRILTEGHPKEPK